MSPGLGRPHDAGRSLELVLELGPTTPTLGVCLGHQAIVEAFGGEVAQARELVHGKASTIRHDGRGLFAALPHELDVGRYHSLAATNVPDVLEVSSRTADGEVMSVRHRELPIEGVQFHPESVLTPHGRTMLQTYLDGSDGVVGCATDGPSSAPERLHSSGPTCTSIFPMFSPRSRPRNAFGAFSIPSTIVSR